MFGFPPGDAGPSTESAAEGVLDSPLPLPLSAQGRILSFFLSPLLQYTLVGISELLSVAGSLELFYSQAGGRPRRRLVWVWAGWLLLVACRACPASPAEQLPVRLGFAGLLVRPGSPPSSPSCPPAVGPGCHAVVLCGAASSVHGTGAVRCGSAGGHPAGASLRRARGPGRFLTSVEWCRRPGRAPTDTH